MDNRLDVGVCHPLGAQNLGEELAFACHIRINIIAAGVGQVLFELCICCNGLWMLTQVVAHQQVIADTRGGMMAEVEVMSGEVHGCRKRLAPGNPQIAPMLMAECG